ncbi:UNVERIFIED_CONTAM: hypothetical protein HDU68_003950 [Siphonaria sp. JEL0065]|nr:hypothetical protein HDU68_003950 [Siphonaria sp. JEL0065]
MLVSDSDCKKYTPAIDAKITHLGQKKIYTAIMNTTSAIAELHRLLISDIIDLRSEIFSKTERLLDLLGSPASPMLLQEQTFPKRSPSPTVAPETNMSRNISFANSDNNKSASLLSLTVRWTGADHTTPDLEANKSNPPVYEKKSPDPSVHISTGKILQTSLQSLGLSKRKSIGSGQPQHDSTFIGQDEKVRMSRAGSLGGRLKKRGSLPAAAVRAIGSTKTIEARSSTADRPTTSIVEINLIDEEMKKSKVLTQEPQQSEILMEVDEEYALESGTSEKQSIDSIFSTYAFSGIKKPLPPVPALPPGLGRMRKDDLPKKGPFTPRVNNLRNDFSKSSGRVLARTSVTSRRSSILSKGHEPDETNVPDNATIHSDDHAHIQSQYELKVHEIEYSEFPVLKRIQFFFLLPAFDAKGKQITLNYFDSSDFDALNFKKTGLHPKSYFNTLWDFVMTSKLRFIMPLN